MENPLLQVIQELYSQKSQVHLHEPEITDVEKQEVQKALDSGFVSTVGEHVDRFERELSRLIGGAPVLAVTNGTCALHLLLKGIGVLPGSEVITQAFSFVATANAISHCGAKPTFLDIDPQNLGLCPQGLRRFLEEECHHGSEGIYRKSSGSKVSACMPVHVFGLSAGMDKIAEICEEFNLPLVEDAAEGLGVQWKNVHVGRWGLGGALSFNGNKILTTGGGGALVFRDEALHDRLRHLATTAKIPRPHTFYHDQVGYNYRMPALNAALGCGQLSRWSTILNRKTLLWRKYQERVQSMDGIKLLPPPEECHSNYWLPFVLFDRPQDREVFVVEAQSRGIHLRIPWTPLNQLPMYRSCYSGPLNCTEDYFSRGLNLPGGVQGLELK